MWNDFHDKGILRTFIGWWNTQMVEGKHNKLHHVFKILEMIPPNMIKRWIMLKFEFIAGIILIAKNKRQQYSKNRIVGD